jgi:hypothetical protein
MTSAYRPRPTPLDQRLERLRVAGALHRMRLALAVEELRDGVGRLHGAGVVFQVLRALWTGGAVGSSAGWLGALRRLRWLLPFVRTLAAGSGARRARRVARRVVEAGTLGMFVYGLLRRKGRQGSSPDPQTTEPPSAEAGPSA